MTVYLFDNNKELIGAVDPKHIQNYTDRTILNGLITASISVAYAPLLESAYYFGSSDIDNESIFVLYRVTSLKKHDRGAELTGVHILFDELQGEVIREIRPQGVTPSVALDRILEGSQWSVGIVTATGTASATYYYQSRLSAFWSFLQTWNVEFSPRILYADGQIVGRYIDITSRLSDDFGKWYEYGSNLIEIVAEQANENIYTALIGLGKGEVVGSGFGRSIRFDTIEWLTSAGKPVDKPLNQDYVSLPSAVAIHGLRTGIANFPQIDDKEALLWATYNRLLETARPRVEFKADAIEQGKVEIGEIVTVVRDNLNIRYKTRVFELSRNFLDRTVKTFRFGDQIVTTSADRLKQSGQALKQQENQMLSLYEANRQAIVDSYVNGEAYEYRLLAGNEYGLPAGTYSFDRPIDQNPTSVIYYGGGRFLISNDRNPDGTWNWRTFGDGSGLGADLVTANNIAAGAITTEHIDAAGIDAGKIIVDGANLDDAWVEIQNDYIALGQQISQLKTGGSNLILNSNLGTPEEPSDAWWSESLTFGESRKRGLTFGGARAAAITFGKARIGDV